MKLRTITSRSDAVDFAIEWQNWQAGQIMSIGEIIAWQRVFNLIADKYELRDEFIENGIL